MQKRVTEFITAYGWLMLIILVGIALALYVKVDDFNTRQDQCSLPTGLGCVEFSASATGLSIVVANGKGQDIVIESVQAAGCEAELSHMLAKGERTEIAVEGCPLGELGDKVSTVLIIKYRDAEGVVHDDRGELTVTIK